MLQTHKNYLLCGPGSKVGVEDFHGQFYSAETAIT